MLIVRVAGGESGIGTVVVADFEAERACTKRGARGRQRHEARENSIKGKRISGCAGGQRSPGSLARAHICCPQTAACLTAILTEGTLK